MECQADGMFFNRFFMKAQTGNKMIMGRHHPVIQSALDRTMLHPSHPDFISRLIINVPPGYSKTVQACVNYIARGLAVNSYSRFMHLSYSHTLALQNSAQIRQIVKSGDYMQMWPTGTKDDTDSKALWWNTNGGGVYATSSGGQVTGFRAGQMTHAEQGFCGALVIDDPVKPDDARHENKRRAINDQFNSTIASRLAVETIPIILIMQRLHWDDMAGFLLRGGSGEKWHHLNLPVLIDNAESYPEEYTHGIPIDHGLEDGWLWPVKHNESNEAGLRADRRRYSAQYMQAPTKIDEERALWNDALLSAARIDVPDPEEATRTIVAVDPAVSSNEDSDDHGIIVGSKYTDTLFSIDGDYTVRGSPKTWATAAIAAYKKHNADAIVIETNQGGDMCESTLRNAGYRGRIIRVHAVKGKTLRAEPVAALYEMGFVKHRPGLAKLDDEMIFFDTLSQKVHGKSPNRLDAATYLLTELSGIDTDMRDLLTLAIGANS